MWRQDPAPAEVERPRRTAASVSRRARLAQWADTIGAAIASTALITIAVLNRDPRTLAVAVAALGLMLLSVIRNRKLREAEITMLTGATAEMLDQSIERAKATRKRMRFNLAAGPLAIPIFAFLLSTRGPAHGILTTRFHVPPHFVWTVTAVFLVVAVWMMIEYARGFMRSGTELEQLSRLREAYRAEQGEAE
jgi:hypothetical protein